MKKLFLVLMSLCMLFSLTVTASAAYNLPDVDTVWTDKETYPYGTLVKSSDTVYKLYLSTKQPYVTYGPKYVLDGQYLYYKFTVGTDTAWQSQGGAQSGATFDNLSLIVDTSTDIYSAVDNSLYMTSKGDFFPPPPQPLEVVIQGVTGEAMEMTMPTLAGVMTTLAVCGVGCLALLAVLKLFGKRSLIFRS